MRCARLFLFAALGLLAGCMLPHPPSVPAQYVERCPPRDVAPHGGWLVISYRLPDCREGFRWTDFRSPGPVYAVDGGVQTTILTQAAWDKLLKDQVAGHGGRHPIVYAHGYKTSHGGALQRARAIAGLPRVMTRPVIAVTWPSYADLAKYFWDQTNNHHVRKSAAAELRRIGALYAGTVLIAHSMGNHLLLEALDGAGKPPFGQLILASPDVDRAELVRLLARPQGLGIPATLYASRADQALSAAWRSHGLPRGGDLSRWVSGREMEYAYIGANNTQIVDTSYTPAGATGHAAFIETEAGAADLCRLLDGIDPKPGRDPFAPNHWTLKQASPGDDCARRAVEAVNIATQKDVR